MKSIKGKHILVIEDNPGDQILLKEILFTSKLLINKLYFACSLAEVFSNFLHQHFDIILLDLTLPDSNGLETFRSIKSAFSKIPIVILSGLTDTEIALKAISEGAQDYLLKNDVEEKILVKTIRYSIERKKTLEELRISNDRYNLVSKATNDLVWDWDVIKNTVYRNAEQFVRILKLPIEEKDMLGEYWFSKIHPEDEGDLLALIEQLHKNDTQNNFEIEYRFLKGDNQYSYLLDRGYVVRDSQGTIQRIIGSTKDINERKLAEAELSKLSLIAKETSNSVVITDTNGNVIWVNEAFTQITEYTLAEVIGKKPGDFLQGKESDKVAIEYMHQQISQQLPFKCVILNYSKSRRKYWLDINGQPIFDEHKRLSHFFAIQTDITEKKLAEDAIKKSEEEYRHLFNNNPASIWIWLLSDLRICVVNDTALQLFGYTRQEFLEMTVVDLRPESEENKIKDFAKIAAKTKDFYDTRVWKLVDKKHNELFLEISIRRILYNNEPAMLAIAINITEKILLEKKLQQEKIIKQREITQAVISAQEKEREEIGRELHDNINQILAGSRLYLGLVKNKIKGQNKFLNETDKLINTAIEEIRTLSHSLIPPSMEEEAFQDAVNSIIEMTTIDNHFTIEKIIDITDKSKLTDELRLTIYRIIQEQFNNILKYAKPKKVWLKLYQPGDKIMLSIKDDGVGFNTSSKTPGVGLMNIKTRASLFNGEMTIISAPGKGCEISICFN